MQPQAPRKENFIPVINRTAVEFSTFQTLARVVIDESRLDVYSKSVLHLVKESGGHSEIRVMLNSSVLISKTTVATNGAVYSIPGIAPDSTGLLEIQARKLETDPPIFAAITLELSE